MEIPVVIGGVTRQAITLKPRGIISFGPKLLVDGQPAMQRMLVKQRALAYVITNDQGEEIEVIIRRRFWDPVPDLEVMGQRIVLTPPLKTHEHVWVCLPFALVAIGGLLGGLCAVITMNINYSLFRRVSHPGLKYLLTGLVTLGALSGFFVIAMGLRGAVGRG